MRRGELNSLRTCLPNSLSNGNLKDRFSAIHSCPDESRGDLVEWIGFPDHGVYSLIEPSFFVNDVGFLVDNFSFDVNLFSFELDGGSFNEDYDV